MGQDLHALSGRVNPDLRERAEVCRLVRGGNVHVDGQADELLVQPDALLPDPLVRAVQAQLHLLHRHLGEVSHQGSLGRGVGPDAASLARGRERLRAGEVLHVCLQQRLGGKADLGGQRVRAELHYRFGVVVVPERPRLVDSLPGVVGVGAHDRDDVVQEAHVVDPLVHQVPDGFLKVRELLDHRHAAQGAGVGLKADDRERVLPMPERPRLVHQQNGAGADHRAAGALTIPDPEHLDHVLTTATVEALGVGLLTVAALLGHVL